MVALRRPAKMVARGIAGRVAFRLNNAPAQPAFGQVVHQDFSDQESRQRQRFARKLRPQHPSVAKFRVCYAHVVAPESGGSLLNRRANSAWSITTAGSRWIASKYFFWNASPVSEGAHTAISLARKMFAPSETGDAFQKKYCATTRI